MACVNDSSDNLLSNPKLFAGVKLYFLCIVHNIITSVNNLNDNLDKVSDWVFLWKIHFNPDPYMQTQEVIFTLKGTVVQIGKALINDRLPVSKVS